jgi:alpha-D-xyloside xylohydrolase
MKFYVKENHLVLNPGVNDLDQEKIQFGDMTIHLSEDGLKANISSSESKFTCTVQTRHNEEGAVIHLEVPYKAVFGLGERFDAVNQKGMERSLEVIEKFCHQGPITYCPIPFFFTDTGFGVYIDTLRVSEVSFKESIVIGLKGSVDELPELVLFFGRPKEILGEFSRLTGAVKLPAKWAFGPWISANRWNNQAEVENQVALLKKHGFPATVMVVEAWSDESTFYLWNGAAYKVNDGSCGFCADELDFTASSYWPDPKALIERLHEEGIHFILWQVPVIKKCEEGKSCPQHDADWNYAAEHGLVVLNADGSPYTIPDGHWFSGSMVPDFTNPETVKWWFEKRKYLLEMGVDGFKTDGGEFICKDDITFFDGSTGKEMRNGFVKRYMETYNDFVGADRVLFSRAGYTGQQRCPIQWAGDQESTWDEFRAIVKAGLSIGLSGVPFWSFDIGGFAGALPTPELYERSTQMAVFAPVMQWHTEPVGGQFAEIMPSAKGINDRSPWNMAEVYGYAGLLDRLRFHYFLRSNLIPTLYHEALVSQETGLPMMRHLALEYPEDANALDIEDAFMLGGLLIAPILWEGQKQRKVYLPEGQWTSLWSQRVYEGGRWVDSEVHENRIPVYIKHGWALALNLGASLKLGSPVGTGMGEYEHLCFYLAGDKGQTHFRDDRGNALNITWNNDDVIVERISGHVAVQILRQLEHED